MKYFIAVTLIAAVASAGVHKPTLQADEDAQIQEIINAIYSPNTDPATVAILEQMLHEILGISTPDQPIHVGPEIIEHPISVGPEIIEHPISGGPAIIDFPFPESAVNPTPIAPAPVAPAPASSPLVQIIVNVQQTETVQPNPVDVVGVSPVVPEEQPINVVDVMPVLPVVVPEIDPTPVNVVEEAFVPQEPVIVAPIIISPVAVGPEILN